MFTSHRKPPVVLRYICNHSTYAGCEATFLVREDYVQSLLTTINGD